jgi:hypothetical protein
MFKLVFAMALAAMVATPLQAQSVHVQGVRRPVGSTLGLDHPDPCVRASFQRTRFGGLRAHDRIAEIMACRAAARRGYWGRPMVIRRF